MRPPPDREEACPIKPPRPKKRLRYHADSEYNRTRTMRHLTTFRSVLALAALFAPPPSASADEATALFRAVAREHARISSIDADITQYISEPGRPREIFKGRYRADARGRFRIDYTVPSRQVVRSDGRVFEWYYPDERLLYYSESPKNEGKGPEFNPLEGIEEALESRFTLSGGAWRLYGFFRPLRVYHLHDAKTGLDIEVRVDPSIRAVIEKTVRDRRGYELIRESYRGHRKLGEIFFPSRVSVTTRTARGITSNVTDYARVILNGPMPDAVFRADYPRTVTRRRLGE